MDAKLVAQQMMMMVLLMVTGYVCVKTRMIKTEVKQSLSALVVNVFNPAQLVFSVASSVGTIPKRNAIIAFAVAAGMYVFLIIAAHTLGVFASKDRMTRNVRHLMYIFANTGFIGIPLVRAVLGPEYLIYVAITNIEYCLLIYTYGYMQMQRDGEKFSLKALKQMFNIGTVVTVFVLVVFMCSIHLPQMIVQTCSYLGSATTPIAMMILGVTMAEQKQLRSIFLHKSLYLFDFMKMLALPVLMGFILKQIPIAEEIRQTMLFMAAVPVGNMPLMLILERGLDARDCSDGIIQTTVLSVITIPIVVFLYLHM